ncbi:MAG: DUF2470 domain-containing protein [Phycisphaerales bacterium]|nr:DUF2470 domain-containing protein [Phycisphaerales bacterium]
MNTLPPDIRAAAAFLRGNLSGLIRFDTEYMPIRVVLAPDGRIVASVMESMLRSSDCALHLPEEPEDQEQEVIQLMVSLERFEEDGEYGHLADRWRIYHGDPPDVRWAVMTIDFCKFGKFAIDGETMVFPNLLSDDEAAVCRLMNQDRAADLRALALRFREIDIEEPRLVGVDPLGFDIRGQFDVVRIDSDRDLVSGEDAIAHMDELLASAD